MIRGGRLGVAVGLLVAFAACDKGSGGGGEFLMGPDGGPAPVAPPEAAPIQATFTQATFSTAYSVSVTNADSDHVDMVWSGPNCGTFAPTVPMPCDAKQCSSKFDWSH